MKSIDPSKLVLIGLALLFVAGGLLAADSSNSDSGMTFASLSALAFLAFGIVAVLASLVMHRLNRWRW